MERFRNFIIYFLPLILLFASGNIVRGEPLNATAVFDYYWQYEEGGMSEHNFWANLFNHGVLEKPGDAHEASCLKCHTSHGFMKWQETGFTPPKDELQFTPVRPFTATGPVCATCHDPKITPSSTSDPILRLKGNPPKLMGGYTTNGVDVGTGAICMVCHSTDRGLNNDKTKPFKNHLGPHESAQTDVLMGENLFYVKTGQTDPHLEEISNTCVGCHMPKETNINMMNSDHTFKASFDQCRTCHEGNKVEMKGKPDMDLGQVKNRVNSGIKILKGTIEGKITDFIQTGLDSGKFRLRHMTEEEVLDKDFTSFFGGKPSKLDFHIFHGFMAVNVELNGKKYLSFIEFLESNGVGLLETVQGQIITKAGWNLSMLKYDNSNGAHNTNFVIEALEITQKKVEQADFKNPKLLSK